MPPTGDLTVERPRPILYAAAALSLVAALTHLWVMPEHFEEWWEYGGFFLASTVAQAPYVPLLLRGPNRTIFLLGIGGNLAIVSSYLLTRTGDIPFCGPHAGSWRGWLHRPVRDHLGAGEHHGTWGGAVTGPLFRGQAPGPARLGRDPDIRRARRTPTAPLIPGARSPQTSRGPAKRRASVGVAGAGFEPATFGL
jgi:hypothetical protein